MSEKQKAFSYIRFSTPDQIRGDSLRRQLAAAERWAEENYYQLDTSLRDTGVSAFKGRNIYGPGALGRFVQAMVDGRVEPGSVLIVESLDRLSRQNPWDALTAFQLLLRNGIEIVCTMDNNRRYTEEAIRADPMVLLTSILVMVRAHEESEMKSRRVKAAWQARRKAAQESGRIMTARAPGWLKVSNGRFEKRDERVAVVRRIYEMAAAGMGQEAICRVLNQEQEPLWGNGGRVGKYWHRSHIKALLISRAPAGFYQPHTTAHDSQGKVLRTRSGTEIAGYFPEIVEPELFQKVHSMILTDAPREAVALSGLRNPLAGLCRCLLCGNGMTRVMKGASQRAGGARLVCTYAKVGRRCEYHSIRADDVEAAILDNVPTLRRQAPPGDALVPMVAAKLAEVTQAASAQSELNAAILRAEPTLVGEGYDIVALLNDQAIFVQAKRSELADVERRNHALQQTQDRLDDLHDLCSEAPRDPVLINAVMRQVWDTVLIDVPRRRLDLVWKSGERSSIEL